MLRFSILTTLPQSVKLRKQHTKKMAQMKVRACVTCGGVCDVCAYSDECACNGIPSITVECVKLELCKSRHVIPDIDGAVFQNTLDPTNVGAIRVECEKSLKAKVSDKNIEYLVLYVTGLSVALVEVINWCLRHNVRLTLMHYNKDTGEYYHQCLQWM